MDYFERLEEFNKLGNELGILVNRVMMQRGISVVGLARLIIQDLDIKESTAVSRIEEIRQGYYVDIDSQGKAKALKIKRLSYILYRLEIPKSDEIIVKLRQRHPEFEYPPRK